MRPRSARGGAVGALRSWLQSVWSVFLADTQADRGGVRYTVRINVMVLGVLAILWGGWGVARSVSFLTDIRQVGAPWDEVLRTSIRDETEETQQWQDLSSEEQRGIRAVMSDMARSIASAVERGAGWFVIERETQDGWEQLLRAFPHWRGLSAEQEAKILQAVSDWGAYKAMVYRHLHESHERLLQMRYMIQWGELLMGLVWLTLGIHLLIRASEAIFWLSWFAVLTVLWVAIGPFLLEGFAERKMLAGYREETVQTQGVGSGRQFSLTVNPLLARLSKHELETGWVTVQSGLRRTAPALVWSFFALWACSRPRPRLFKKR